ncbi:hypothetical protein CXU21_05630 [Akkermansia muciniphila]|nr:hypothetical protein CXU21_05630 [Akkermansia muciniphila]
MRKEGWKGILKSPGAPRATRKTGVAARFLCIHSILPPEPEGKNRTLPGWKKILMNLRQSRTATFRSG